MATPLFATPVMHSSAVRNCSLIGEVRGFYGPKPILVSCRQISVSVSAKGCRTGAIDNAGSQDVVSDIKSSMNPLLNIPPAEWMATFSDKDVRADAHGAVVAPAFQQLEPSTEYELTSKLHQKEIRRTDKVIFTEEKARRLRKANRDSQTFHDKWYHSAIASRLASPE